ncbi:MAG TPA: 2OG-Fe(II) oxygenase [Rhizobacter sp.]|nr:2OG-Fe(II) oxygenase [Rhizobacter sp.]
MTQEKTTAGVANPFANYSDSDTVTIRGKRLVLAELVDPKLFDELYLRGATEQARNAAPYAYIVDDSWFNPVLLELAAEEFDMFTGDWTKWENRYQATFRSPLNPVLGPASSLYFSLVNSSWFVNFLSSIMGIPNLIADQQLYGGGLHESRNGGKFGIHRDFDRHANTGLTNELSIITYLNKNWDPEWGGALELWDQDKSQSVQKIQPEFGRSIVMKHGAHSFHGHPKPLKMPEGQRRRSLSAYYYSNSTAPDDKSIPASTYFLVVEPKDVVVEALKSLTPPLLWNAVLKVFRS